MRGQIRIGCLAATMACAFVALTATASAEVIRVKAGASLLAFLGSPGAMAAPPLGLGAANDFGIGENMVFRGGETPKIGKNVQIKLAGKTDECKDTFAMGTLVSNTTAKTAPIGFDIQSVDFQSCTIEKVAAATFTDTKDNVWRARLKQGVGATTIEGIVADVGGTLVRGSVEGTWINGAAATPPCIELTKIGTLATDPLNVKVESIKGEVCLISSNNDGPNNIVIEEK